MRIAVPDFVSSTFIPLIAAKELGLFKEEGQEVEIVHIPALGDVEALRDGAVDFSAGPAHSPLMIFPDWRGVKLVATIAQGTPWMLVMRAVVRAQSVIRHDPLRAAEVATKLFPAVEAGLMGQILARDAEFYQPSISTAAIEEMNRFATAVGLLSSPVSYEQVVAKQFRGLWSD